jgi:hypothetical protein
MIRRAALVALLTAAVVFAADVTGKWVFQVETSAGSGTPTFTLKQAGEKLAGKYSGALGDADVTGTVTGTAVTIQFEASGMNVVYKGELQGADNIKGTVDLGGQAQGTFTGTRGK